MNRRPTRVLVTVLGVAGVAALGFVAGAMSKRPEAFSHVGHWRVPKPAFDGVLDGDTIVDQGRAVHIRGLDAPELGPWAKCWAEAALAGHARANLQSILADNRGWQLRDFSSPDADGKPSARVVDRHGYDIIDDMVVFGYAASTSGHWDWCGKDAGLRPVLDGDKPPHGPSLWWPTGSMLDPRAVD